MAAACRFVIHQVPFKTKAAPGRRTSKETPMRTLLRTSVVLLITLLMSVPAFAWGDPGHMAVAQIAYDNLNQTAKSRVDQLARQVVFENNRYNFVTLACWMDDIRDEEALEPLKDWHFITRKFIVSGPAVDEPPPPVNVQSILDWSIARLRARRDSDLVQAYTLAYLAHLTGDVHQPLHSTTRYTVSLPDGDRGGNLFRLHANAIRPNLHSYWDGAAGFFDSANIQRPLNRSERQRLRAFAQAIQQDFPANEIENVDDLNPAKWVQESHDLAISAAYKDIIENTVPSIPYRDNTRDTSRKRIATAGYRLARVLNQALGN